MKLPLKWKLFRFVNYLLLVAFLFLLILVMNAAVKGALVQSLIIISVLISIESLLIILISLLNLYITYKFFPHKMLYGRIKKLYTVSAFVYALTLSGLIYFLITAISEELNSRQDDNTGTILIIIFACMLAMGIFSVIMQFSVNKFLAANYKKNMLVIINEIGEN
jgi:hypothetical protein